MAEREGRCRWCGRRFAIRQGPGRPRRFCRAACRQREYEARRRGAEAGLSEAELVVARDELHRLYDHLWVLECAIRDVDADLAEATTVDEYQQAVSWLLDAARPLVAMAR